MMRSLYSGVSGLKGHQTRMDVIGNNIANVNTTGFKSGRVTFSDTLSQTLSGAGAPSGNLGGTNPKQIGLGTGVSTIDTIFTDGSVQATGKNTDLCLSGNGLFIVKSGNQEYYTRNGAFEFDKKGNYVMPGSGMKVQGYMATDGVLKKAQTDIKIDSGKLMPAKASSQVTYTNNLNASLPVISSYTFKDANNTSVTRNTSGYYITASSTQPVTLTMSDGTKQTVTTGTYVIGHSMPITTAFKYYDSLGNPCSATVTVEKAGTDTITYTDEYGNQKTKRANHWVVSLPNTEVDEADGSKTTLSISPTTLSFDEDGVIRAGTTGGVEALTYDPNSTVPAGPATAKGRTSANTASLTAVHTAPNGSTSPQNLTLDYSTVSSYANLNTISNEADGYAAGSLSSVSIDGTGTITGTYTNGVKQVEAQILLARFNNAAGLTKTGNSLYQVSNNSGDKQPGTAEDLGCSITSSALEMSNVDIASEFSDMIVTQRGFQSNSKIITVSDEMLETMINMKR